jgi:hypothetical protein
LIEEMELLLVHKEEELHIIAKVLLYYVPAASEEDANKPIWPRGLLLRCIQINLLDLIYCIGEF